MTTQGKRLKRIRQTLNLSGEEFGAKIGVSKQYVSNLEADRNVLNNEKLVLLLVDLNVNLNYLIGGKGRMFNEQQPNASNEELEQKVVEVMKKYGVIEKWV